MDAIQPCPRTRSTIAALLNRLPGGAPGEEGRNRISHEALRRIDVDLFHIIDSRPVRRTRRATLDTFPDNPLDCPKGQLPPARIEEEWVSEMWEWGTTDIDEDGNMTSAMAFRTYISAEGKHVQHAEYEVVPRYTVSMNDALWFRFWAFGPALRLLIEELEFGPPSRDRATLLLGKEPVASYEAELPVAIVGAVLMALLNERTRDLGLVAFDES